MFPMSGTMVNKIKAYSDLFRVENSLTGLIGVVIGAVVVNGIDFSLSDAMIVSFFGLSVMFFMFSWNAYNDITDIETDRLNRPDRPLPSGKISSSSAMIGLIGTMVLSIVSLLAGLWKLSSEGETDSIISSVVIWAAAILLLILYEGVSGIRGLKHSGLIGNFCIAVAIGMDVVFGASGLGSPTDQKVLALAGMAVSFSLAREVIKDIEDIHGDFDRVTFPKKVGIENARSVAWLLTLLAVVLLFAPFMFGIFPIHHILFVAPGGFLLMLVKSKLFLEEDRAAQYLIKRALQISMVGVIVSACLVG